MSVKHHDILIACLRIEDAQTHAERKQSDRAAVISEIFNKIISNSQAAYCASVFVMVDKMLVFPFQGRSGFLVYMPKKPKKYGMKLMCLINFRTPYLINAYIYNGKDSEGVGLTEKEGDAISSTGSFVQGYKIVQGYQRQ